VRTKQKQKPTTLIANYYAKITQLSYLLCDWVHWAVQMDNHLVDLFETRDFVHCKVNGFAWCHQSWDVTQNLNPSVRLSCRALASLAVRARRRVGDFVNYEHLMLINYLKHLMDGLHLNVIG
jgi:hypothetical protein